MVIGRILEEKALLQKSSTDYYCLLKIYKARLQFSNFE